jgi:hypothetical protein
MAKLFTECRDVLKNSVLPGTHSIALTFDIWSGNAREDYISVVTHYVSANWELQKRVVGFRLIEVKHSGENIAERIANVVEEFGLIDKVFAITLDNASSNAKAMETLTPIFFGYLGSYPAPTPSDPNKVNYLLVHQRCTCHIINLIVKSGLKRLKPFTEDVRIAINFLNSSNQSRWNSTYLMLKHLIPYKNIFSVFINSHYGSELLTRNHWYVLEKIYGFLELYYDCTLSLSGVYYPTSPLVLHHILGIVEHLHDCERDQNLRFVVGPMKLKFLKY